MYSSPGCHLCDEAWATLLALQSELGYSLDNVDITNDPELERSFRPEIPVVTLDGAKLFKYRVDAGRLRAALNSRKPR